MAPLLQSFLRSATRCSSCSPLSFTKLQQRRLFTQHLSQPVQIYRSASTDPYLNLSIEHHLLQRSDPESTVLFLYANRPCVVIGRNQNPWLEVNLHQLRLGLPGPAENGSSSTRQSKKEPISLVRRRSGGGTVFHDAGNINWSVICPPAVFDRDRHAEIVVRALKALNVSNARVNERHDIVLDVDGEAEAGSHVKTFKVSGSAYKLTRTRSLHHGTCLLNSPNLGHVSSLLRSPAEPFIKSRGVESVRSPIRNIGIDRDSFEEAVIREFEQMYAAVGQSGGVTIETGEALGVKAVGEGLRELTSPEWIFGQTPQFTFSTHMSAQDPRERPPLPQHLPSDFRATLTVRHGEIVQADISGLDYTISIDASVQDKLLGKGLLKRQIFDISDWRETLRAASPVPLETEEPGHWLNRMFGIETTTRGWGESLARGSVDYISDSLVVSYLDSDPAGLE